MLCITCEFNLKQFKSFAQLKHILKAFEKIPVIFLKLKIYFPVMTSP